MTEQRNGVWEVKVKTLEGRTFSMTVLADDAHEAEAEAAALVNGDGFSPTFVTAQ